MSIQTLNNSESKLSFRTKLNAMFTEVYGGSFLSAGSLGALSFAFSVDVDTGLYRPASNSIGLVAGGTEIARLTLAGFGIGAAPSYPLDVVGEVLGPVVARVNNLSADASAISKFRGQTGSPNSFFDLLIHDGGGSATVYLLTGSAVGAIRSQAAAHVWQDQIGTTEFGRLTANGLSIGVTPPPWNSAVNALTLTSYLAFTGTTGNITSNAYLATGNVFKYIGSGAATMLQVGSGKIDMYVAPSVGSGPNQSLTWTRVFVVDDKGNAGFGANTSATRTLSVSKNITGGSTIHGIASEGEIQTDVTNSAYLFSTTAKTAPSTAIAGSLAHYMATQGTFGSGSTVLAQYGFYAASSLTGASYNYGFRSDIAAGSQKYNFYANGTAMNVFRGNTRIGGGADPANTLDITGSLGRGTPVAKTADFTVAATDSWLINNKSGSSCTVTLPTASSFTGREIMIQNYQAQTVVSASANVVPIAGGAAGTAILAAAAGKWAVLVSDGTNWLITQAG